MNISKRRFLNAIAICGAGLCFVNNLSAFQARTKDSEEKPNIVFLYADDLGFGSIGINGSKDIATPNIDKLAAQGVNCTQMYSGSATCSPSRASLITGRFPLRVDIPFAILSNDGSYLPARKDYLPQILKANGYHTAHIGKWHLGGINRPEEFDARKAGKKISDGPLEHGFDTSVVMMEDQRFRMLLTRIGGVYNNGTRYLYRDNERIPPYDGHWTTAKGDYAVEYIQGRKDKDQPFFLNVWFDVPHSPIEEPPAHIMEQYKDRVYLGNPNANKTAQKYCAMITHMDEQIGRIVEALKKSGKYDNTLIAFSSDNGGDLRHSKISSINLPFRGRKAQLLNGGITMPSFFVWKGRIPAGEDRSQAIHQMDLLPTFCEAAGINLPHIDDKLNYDGISVLSYLRENTPLPDRDLLFTSGSNYHTVIRNGRWKYIIRKNTPSELYDLDNDKTESNNLCGKMPELEMSLSAALDAYREEAKSTPVTLDKPIYTDKSWTTAEAWKNTADTAAQRHR